MTCALFLTYGRVDIWPSISVIAAVTAEFVQLMQIQFSVHDLVAFVACPCHDLPAVVNSHSAAHMFSDIESDKNSLFGGLV